MKDEILQGLDGLLDGIDDIGKAHAEDAAPPVPKKPRAKKAVAPVKAATPEAKSEPAVTPPVESSPAIDTLLKHHDFCGKRVKIVIERSHDPKDLAMVFMKLNDYTCVITRGEEVDVPVELLGVLDNASQTTFSQPHDGVLIPHNSLRFPYRIVRQ